MTERSVSARGSYTPMQVADFLYVELNLADPDSFRQIVEDIRWLQEHRERRTKHVERVRILIWSLVSSGLGVILSSAISFLIARVL